MLMEQLLTKKIYNKTTIYLNVRMILIFRTKNIEKIFQNHLIYIKSYVKFKS